MRVLHVTSVHPRRDVRIFFKECVWIARTGVGEVALLVLDGLGDDMDCGIAVRDFGRPRGGRIGRAGCGNWYMLLGAWKTRPAVVHFHDPELILSAILLRGLGYQIIYDVHEDVPSQTLSKGWIPRMLRRPVAWGLSVMEGLSATVFTAIVAATPTIAARFPPRKTVIVQNFPILSEFMVPDAPPYAQRPATFVYVGGISESRGAREMVRAVNLLQGHAGARLELGGECSSQSLETELRTGPGAARIGFHGWMSRSEVARVLGRARAGLVVLHPSRNYLDAYPVKMFEYMAAGLPVIASDFPLWRRIIERAGCGILVDPLDANAIARAMQWILEHPDEAEVMGRRGRKAVEDEYNWSNEAEKLLHVYRRLGVAAVESRMTAAGW